MLDVKQRIAIASPARGLMVYDIEHKSFEEKLKKTTNKYSPEQESGYRM